MKTRFIIPLVWLAFMLSTSAQTNAKKLEFKVVAPVISPSQLVVYVPKEPLPEDRSTYTGTFIEVRLNSYDFSSFHKVSTAGKLVFLSSDNPESDVVGTLEISPSNGELLVFFMGSYEEKKYSLVAFPSNEVKMGDYCVLNASSYPLLFNLESTKKIVAPKSRIILTPPKERSNVEVYIKKDGETQKTVSSQWRLTKEMREFILYMPSYKTHTIQAVHVRDRLEKPGNKSSGN